MVNIKEIAQKAGVGTTTVSRYLNDSPHISEKTRAKIIQAIQDLDYVPNTAAKRLRTNKTSQIGVVVSRITNPFFATLFDNIERLLNRYGYEVSIMQTYDDKVIERKILDKLKNRSFDGLLMASIEDRDYVKEMLCEYGKQIVLVNEKITGFEANSIFVDQYHVVREALTYLNDNYGPQIAYVTGSINFDASNHGNMRNKAYKDFAEHTGIRLDTTTIFENAHSIEDGKKIVDSLRKLDKMPRSIFSNSDEVATGIIARCTDFNINVPADLAVMGFDDQPFAPYILVPLTTVHQPIFEMANNAVKCLLDRLDVSNDLTEMDLNLKMVIRKSS